MDFGISASQSGSRSVTAPLDQTSSRQSNTAPAGSRFVPPASNVIGLLAQISAEVASVSQSQSSGGSTVFGPSFILPGASGSSLPTSAATSTPGVEPGQPFLRDGQGGAVAIRAATDEQGNPVVTATLSTGEGGIAGFQATLPAFQPPLRSLQPSDLSGPLPQILDAEGNALPVRAYQDRLGGVVLGVDLTGANGAQQTFYSQIDSLGYSPTAGNGPISITDNSGLPVSGQSLTSANGQPFVQATLYRPPGFSQQYQTEVDRQPALSAVLQPSSTTYEDPTGPSGAKIASSTFDTIQGAQVQQVYLNVNGIPQAFYSATGSDGVALQPAVVGAQVIPRAAPFSENPALTETSGLPSLPGVTNFVSNAYRSAQSLLTTQTAFSAFSTLI